MSYNVSFQELAKIQKEILSSQQPISLEKAKKQVETLKRIHKNQEAARLVGWVEDLGL